MLHSDYLVRMLAEFAEAIVRALMNSTEMKDPKGSAVLLDAAIGEAVDMDGSTLLMLSPDSIAQVMQVSGTDPAVSEYIARSLMLASTYYAAEGDVSTSELRAAQARAVAAAYGHDITDMEGSAPDGGNKAEVSMREFLEARKL